MRAAILACVVLALATSGCSKILGIHALSDGGGGGDDDANPPDDAMRDGTMGDGMGDGMTDGMMTDSMTDAMGFVPIGEYAQLAATTNINGNFIIARSFSVGGTTVIIGAGAYVKFETTNGHIKFAIYNDNAASPFTRRALSTDITLDGTPGYNEIALGPHTLPAGTYWMVMATDSNIDIGSLDSNNVPGAGASIAYSGAFPTTYSPQPTSSTVTDRVNIYLKAQP